MGMYRRPTEDDKGKKRLCLNCKAIVPIEDQYCWRQENNKTNYCKLNIRNILILKFK